MPNDRIVTVLNVDDYAAGRYATTRLLRQAGFDVREAQTGTEALRLATEKPGLIVLDINLPDLDGFEVCRRLKADPQTADIPVLQMSASYLGTENRVRGLEGGADAYLTQPVEPRELVATVNALLRSRQVRDAVRESEARFRTLVESTAQVIWTVSPTGDVERDLPSWSAFTGQTRAEYEGRGWLDSVHPEDRERALAAWTPAAPGGQPREAEIRVRRQDGAFRSLLVRGVPMRGEDGRVREWVGAGNDVTEHKRADEALRFLDEAGRTLAASLEVKATLERAAELALGHLADLCTVDLLEDGVIRRALVRPRHPGGNGAAAPLQDRAPRLDDAHSPLATALRTGEPQLVSVVDEQVIRGMTSDEEYRAVLRRLGATTAMAIPLRARGETLGVIGMSRNGETEGYYGPDDLALGEELARRVALAIDNARLYEAAREASQAKSQFLATMSHELRTPMNAIIGYADLLDAEVAGPLLPEQRSQLQRITASSQHLLQLIDSILTFSRLEAGREVVDRDPVDLGTLVRETAMLIEPMAAAKGLAFHVDVPHSPLTTLTDAGKVRQIVLNLLGNAVKFTDSGVVAVRVAADSYGANALLEVSDTGIGILPEQRERIFDPFAQVEQAPSRRVGGTGLGLSVTRHLARLLGGDVVLHSEIGRGSTFSVRLPLHAEAPATAEPASAPGV